MGLMRNRAMLVAAASVGLVGTFAAMLATGGPSKIGTIWFVPT